MPEDTQDSTPSDPTPASGEQLSTGDDSSSSPRWWGDKSAGAKYGGKINISSPDVILSRKNVFDALDELFEDTGLERGSREAMQWFNQLVREMFEQTELSPEETILRDKSRLIQKSGYKREGSMYLFNYLPKGRAKLKYYDTFPLVFILNFTDDGFLGLNLHYLPPSLRQRFFMLMRTKARGSMENKWTKMYINYQLLRKNRAFRFYRPCIRKYKTKYIGSRILHIFPKDWDLVIHLPIERFKKSVRQAIWMESRQKIIEEIQGSAEQ